VHDPLLPSGHRFHMRRISVALDVYLCERFIELCQIIVIQFEFCCRQILLKPVQLGCSWNGHDPGLAGKEPCQSDLSRGRLLLARNPVQEFDKNLILLYSLGGEAGPPCAEVTRVYVA
jgi:hypothetical protein